MTKFVATVRKNSGLIKTGRIVSKTLYPLIGKKVNVTVKEQEQLTKWEEAAKEYINKEVKEK